MTALPEPKQPQLTVTNQSGAPPLADISLPIERSSGHGSPWVTPKTGKHIGLPRQRELRRDRFGQDFTERRFATLALELPACLLSRLLGIPLGSATLAMVAIVYTPRLLWGTVAA